MLLDAYEGEQAVKDARTKYLPATPAQIVDGLGVDSCGHPKDGEAAYLNYLARAVFPDFYTEGIKTLVGIMNEKPAKIIVPPEMEPLLERITVDREDVHTLLRSIHFEVLKCGRAGTLVDLPKLTAPGETHEPYVSLYNTMRIVNWDEGQFHEGDNRLNMLVLDESGPRRKDDFTWENCEEYLVLALGSVDPTAPQNFVYTLQRGTAPEDLSEPVTPKLYGNTLSEIPFTFIGPVDLDSNPDQPPLLGLARICFTLYRAEADYRYSLFMTGQDTLVISGRIKKPAQEVLAGSEETIRVGAGAVIHVEENGRAEYIGVSGSGLSEQRQAIQADREMAAVRTGQLLAPGKMSLESGEALKTRVAAQTATLSSVAIASAKALERTLRFIAKWKGLDPSKVKVEPNLEFSNYHISTQDFVQLITAKKLGFPLSMEAMHEYARERGITRFSFEEELERIRKDPQELLAIMQQAGNVNGNNPIEAVGGPSKKLDEGYQDPSNSQVNKR